MNRPVAFICACIAGIGLLSLGRSTFLTIAYGHGDMMAGNFNRCWYSAIRDPQTGQLMREWGEVGESTEDTSVDRLDMWFVGNALVALGVAIYAAEWASSRPRRVHP
jgi:hypothetical protein